MNPNTRQGSACREPCSHLGPSCHSLGTQDRGTHVLYTEGCSWGCFEPAWQHHPQTSCWILIGTGSPSILALGSDPRTLWQLILMSATSGAALEWLWLCFRKNPAVCKDAPKNKCTTPGTHPALPLDSVCYWIRPRIAFSAAPAFPFSSNFLK